jgi:TrmH family RNA methyltransferase
MPDPINSTSNPRIRNILKLQTSSRDRYNQNLFVIEGFREIIRAIESGIVITELYICNEIDRQGRGSQLKKNNPEILVFELGLNAFSRIAYREASDGIIALALPRNISLSELQLSSNPLILILEAVEKPGNLGAIMRTADAAAVDAVIVCDPLTDIYNPNAIRSAVGCMFSRQIVTCSTSEAFEWLKNNNIRILASALTENAIPYYEIDFNCPAALVMGTEATGLSNEWLEKADTQVIIPMHGIADSLNVSTSAAVLVFEAVRQRVGL